MARTIRFLFVYGHPGPLSDSGAGRSGCPRDGDATAPTLTQEDIGDVTADRILTPRIDARPYGDVNR